MGDGKGGGKEGGARGDEPETVTVGDSIDGTEMDPLALADGTSGSTQLSVAEDKGTWWSDFEPRNGREKDVVLEELDVEDNVDGVLAVDVGISAAETTVVVLSGVGVGGSEDGTAGGGGGGTTVGLAGAAVGLFALEMSTAVVPSQVLIQVTTTARTVSKLRRSQESRKCEDSDFAYIH